ncbi:MAG TPA: hypothetical protein VD970_10090, partial [Acetobacteraceae bacterium]|nr:hypothetical protein [Acetobacteraceae bacterium]
GPATETLRRHCPGRGWYLCDFLDYFPVDAETFLWGYGSPANADRDGNLREYGGARLAPEAAEIVALTLREHPLPVLRAMALNTGRQLVSAALGDALGSRLLDQTTGYALRLQFPPAELARFEAGAQYRGALPAMARPFAAVLAPVLVASLILLALVLARRASWQHREPIAFVLMVLAGLLGNAFAAGALSGVHDRYQARIAWLLPLAAALALMPARRRLP